MKTGNRFVLKQLPMLVSIIVSSLLVACAVSEEKDTRAPSQTTEVDRLAALERTCAETTEEWWNLKRGAATPAGTESIDNDLYEVKIRSGKRRFNCRVTADGDIVSIHGPGKRR